MSNGYSDESQQMSVASSSTLNRLSRSRDSGGYTPASSYTPATPDHQAPKVYSEFSNVRGRSSSRSSSSSSSSSSTKTGGFTPATPDHQAPMSPVTDDFREKYSPSVKEPEKAKGGTSTRTERDSVLTEDLTKKYTPAATTIKSGFERTTKESRQQEIDRLERERESLGSQMREKYYMSRNKFRDVPQQGTYVPETETVVRPEVQRGTLGRLPLVGNLFTTKTQRDFEKDVDRYEAIGTRLDELKNKIDLKISVNIDNIDTTEPTIDKDPSKGLGSTYDPKFEEFRRGAERAERMREIEDEINVVGQNLPVAESAVGAGAVYLLGGRTPSVKTLELASEYRQLQAERASAPDLLPNINLPQNTRGIRAPTIADLKRDIASGDVTVHNGQLLFKGEAYTGPSAPLSVEQASARAKRALVLGGAKDVAVIAGSAVVGAGIVAGAGKLGKTAVTGLRVVDAVDDTVDVIEGGRAIRSALKGDAIGASSALSNIVLTNVGGYTGSRAAASRIDVAPSRPLFDTTKVIELDTPTRFPEYKGVEYTRTPEGTLIRPDVKMSDTPSSVTVRPDDFVVANTRTTRSRIDQGTNIEASQTITTEEVFTGKEFKSLVTKRAFVPESKLDIDAKTTTYITPTKVVKGENIIDLETGRTYRAPKGAERVTYLSERGVDFDYKLRTASATRGPLVLDEPGVPFTGLRSKYRATKYQGIEFGKQKIVVERKGLLRRPDAMFRSKKAVANSQDLKLGGQTMATLKARDIKLEGKTVAKSPALKLDEALGVRFGEPTLKSKSPALKYRVSPISVNLLRNSLRSNLDTDTHIDAIGRLDMKTDTKLDMDTRLRPRLRGRLDTLQDTQPTLKIDTQLKPITKMDTKMDFKMPTLSPTPRPDDGTKKRQSKQRFGIRKKKNIKEFTIVNPLLDISKRYRERIKNYNF